MKTQIFIDNHPGESAADAYDSVKLRLKLMGVNTNEMYAVPNFKTDLNKTEKEAILFNPNHVIITFSMFSEASFDSYGMLVDYLIAAGKHEIKGVVFVDMSGKLPRALDKIIREYGRKKSFGKIKLATLKNNFISIDIENNTTERVYLDFGGIVWREPITKQTFINLFS